MQDRIKIVGFGGSLRKGSYSRAVLNAAKELVPQDAEFEIASIDGFPVFNQDMESSMPDVVKRFKDKIKGADAIVISTPEYNYSVPGYLKNVIDWASRPYGDNSFNDKPVAIMSTGGMLGGVKAENALRQVMVFLNMHVINTPGVVVTFVKDKVDANGVLTDEKTKEQIRKQLEALVQWARRLRK